MRHVLDAPSTAAQSALITMIALLLCVVVRFSVGAPLDTFVFALAPTPSLARNVSTLRPNMSVVPESDSTQVIDLFTSTTAVHMVAPQYPATSTSCRFVQVSDPPVRVNGGQFSFAPAAMATRISEASTLKLAVVLLAVVFHDVSTSWMKVGAATRLVYRGDQRIKLRAESGKLRRREGIQLHTHLRVEFLLQQVPCAVLREIRIDP